MVTYDPAAVKFDDLSHAELQVLRGLTNGKDDAYDLGGREGDAGSAFRSAIDDKIDGTSRPQGWVIRAYCDDPRHPGFRKVIAWTLFDVCPDRVEAGFYVSRSWRRRGIGRALFDHVRLHAPKHATRIITRPWSRGGSCFFDRIGCQTIHPVDPWSSGVSEFSL